MRKKTALRTPQQRETSVRKPGGLIDRGENAQDSATAKSALTNRSHRTRDRKSTRLNSSQSQISYAVFCLKKKKKTSNIVQIDQARVDNTRHPIPGSSSDHIYAAGKAQHQDVETQVIRRRTMESNLPRQRV